MSRKSGHSLEGLDVKYSNHLIILKLCITYENCGCDIQKCGYLLEGLNVIRPNLSRIVYHLTKL